LKTKSYKPWSRELRVLYLSEGKSLKVYNSLFKTGWFSIVLIVSGSIDFIVGPSTIRITAGQLYSVPSSAKVDSVISPLSFYLVTSTIAFAINNRIIRFGTGYIGLITRQSNFTPILTKAEIKRMVTLVELLQKKNSSRQGIIFQDEMVQLCFNLILYEFSAFSYKNIEDTIAVHSRTEKIVMRFIELIQQHCIKHHDVKFYADSLFVSTGHLGKAVRSITGMSAKHFIEMAIISEAYVLLANDKLSITEIGEQLNFSSPSLFSGFFKKYTRMSPTQYRLNLRP